MKEEISTLIALQEIDTELSGLAREIAKLRQELADREKAVADKTALARQCREKAAALEQSRHAIKAVGEDAAERIKERQVKMMQVQTSREHQALLKEIEDAKRQIKETEEQILQVMMQAEEKESEAVSLENLCQNERQQLVEASAQTEKAIQQIEVRRTEAMSRRDQLVQEMPAAQMKRYDKLLGKRKGLAVVRISAGVCQGCFMAVPPQQFNQVRKGSEICSCPACQRILYYLPDGNEEQLIVRQQQEEDVYDADADDMDDELA